MKKLRRLLHKRRKAKLFVSKGIQKSKGICIEGYPEKYNFLLFLRILHLQPRR